MASPHDKREWKKIPCPHAHNTQKEEIVERNPYKEPTYSMKMTPPNFELLVQAIEACGGKLEIPEPPRDPYGGKYARRNDRL